uniref:hypothetical protein n=1 Tax=Salmonella sp. s51228 TaxID=3159652 RepID=UPI00397F8D84
GFTGVCFPKALMQMNSFFGLSEMRLDNVKGDYILRSSPRDLLRVSRVIADVMLNINSNFTSILSNFPLHSTNLKRVARNYQYGWWINGAEFNNDHSNLIDVVPGDMIASIDCNIRLYIVPS